VHAYGRVTELSWLLNVDTEAAEVMLSGRVFNWVMFNFWEQFSGTGSWNSEGSSSVSVSSQFLESDCLQVSDPGGLVTPPHAHEGLCTGR